MVTTQVRKILFVELLGGIGDALIALPAIQALARSHPAAELTVLTLPPGGELLESAPQNTRVVYADSCPYQLECLDIPPEEVVVAGLELINRQ